MLLLAVTYVVPLAVLAITYTRVGVELWGHKSIGERTASQDETLKSKRKVETADLTPFSSVAITILQLKWMIVRYITDVNIGNSVGLSQIRRWLAEQIQLKLFKSGNVDLIKCCQSYFRFELPSVLHDRRARQELIRRWDSERELFDDDIAHT